MNTSRLATLIGFLLILNLFGCQKDEYPVISEGNGKVKRILISFSPHPDAPTSIVKEFEYDETGRISRTSTPMYQEGIMVTTTCFYSNQRNLQDTVPL